MISFHAYSLKPEPGDLKPEDLEVLYGLFLSEKLLEVFFHSGGVCELQDFIEYVSSSQRWFYGVQINGLWAGVAVADGFSNSNRAAFVHTCAFACGRGQDYVRAGHKWFELLKESGGLHTVLGVIPAPFRGARYYAEAIGMRAVLRLPRGICILRNKKWRTVDSVLYCREL